MSLYSLQKRFEILARVDHRVYFRLANRIRIARFLIEASVKANLKYLTGINVNELKKQRPLQKGEDARAYYQALTEEAKSGPIFTEEALMSVQQAGDIPKEKAKALANLVSRDDNPDLSTLDFVTQALLHSQPPEQATYTQFLTTMKGKTEEELKALAPTNEDPNDPRTTEEGKKLIVYTFPDGYFVTKVPIGKPREYEGTQMQNCIKTDHVNTKEFVILSIRDSHNKPHVSLSLIREDNQLAELQGKNNKLPAPKYLPYVEEFMDTGLVEKNIVYWALFNREKFIEEISKPKPKGNHRLERFAVNQTVFTDLFDTKLADFLLKNYTLGAITNPNITGKKRSEFIYKAIDLDYPKVRYLIRAADSLTSLKDPLTKACHKFVHNEGQSPGKPRRGLMSLAPLFDDYTLAWVMSQESYAPLRVELAKSPRTPKSLLKKLTKDENRNVRNAATEALGKKDS